MRTTLLLLLLPAVGPATLFPVSATLGRPAAAAAPRTGAAPPDLLSNGDFERGAVGFSSDYGRYAPGRATTAPGQEGWLTVTDDPRRFNPLGASFGDHTSGKGRMLVVNGATNPGPAVWSQTVRLGAGARASGYEFGFWVASWGRVGGAAGSPNPARLAVFVNGERLRPSRGAGRSDFAAPSAAGMWARCSGLWVPADSAVGTRAATVTAVTITVVNENTEFLGNDFALDDLSFTPLTGRPWASTEPQETPPRQ